MLVAPDKSSLVLPVAGLGSFPVAVPESFPAAFMASFVEVPWLTAEDLPSVYAGFADVALA